MVARIRTRASRPVGATSAFVGLQIAPSTYSRPAITAGENTSGSAQDALRACATVARGATNSEAAAALFLSQKTIEYHLSNVYRKTGLHSRAELSQLTAAAS